MEYEEIVNAIYMYLIGTLNFEMCGPVSDKALHEIETILEENTNLDQSVCSDIESLITDGFAENAENGFYQGFQCAAALLMGANKMTALKSPKMDFKTF